MSEPETISATDASRNFSELMSRVAYGGESFVIKKGNRIMARLEPAEGEASAIETKKAAPEKTREAPAKPQEAKPVEAAQPEAKAAAKTAAKPAEKREAIQRDVPRENPDYVKQVAAAMDQMLAD